MKEEQRKEFEEWFDNLDNEGWEILSPITAWEGCLESPYVKELEAKVALLSTPLYSRLKLEDKVELLQARNAELEQREKAVPDGWKMVPIEPTDKMCAAAINATMKHRQQVNGIPQYKAMLAAAPQPSDAEIVKGGVKFIMGNGLDEGTYMVPAPHKE